MGSIPARDSDFLFIYLFIIVIIIIIIIIIFAHACHIPRDSHTKHSIFLICSTSYRFTIFLYLGRVLVGSTVFGWFGGLSFFVFYWEKTFFGWFG